MYLTIEQTTPGAPRLTRKIPALAVAPTFGELLNSLGNLWQVPEVFTLCARHLTREAEDAVSGNEEPYSVFYLVARGFNENTHPKNIDVNMPWVQLIRNFEDKSPTAVHVEYYVGKAKIKAMSFDFHSMVTKAIDAAKFLMGQHAALDYEKYQEFADSF